MNNKFSSTTKEILYLIEKGMSNEEVIAVISDNWDIQDRLKIVRMVDYALSNQAIGEK